MHKDRQERQFTEQTTAADQIELLHEQIEYWRELTNTLKSELRHKECQLQELQQELSYTNKELCDALMIENVSVEEAKNLAVKAFQSKKFLTKALAELLSAIYSSAVQPEDLAQIEEYSITKTSSNSEINRVVVANSKKLKERSNQLNIQYKNLGEQFIRFKDQLISFKELRTQLKDSKCH